MRHLIRAGSLRRLPAFLLSDGEPLDFFSAVEVWSVDGGVVTYQRDTVRAFLYFLCRCFLAVYQHDGYLTILNVVLAAHDDDIAVHDGRFHRLADDAQAEVFVAVRCIFATRAR